MKTRKHQNYLHLKSDEGKIVNAIEVLTFPKMSNGLWNPERFWIGKKGIDLWFEAMRGKYGYFEYKGKAYRILLNADFDIFERSACKLESVE